MSKLQNGPKICESYSPTEAVAEIEALLAAIEAAGYDADEFILAGVDEANRQLKGSKARPLAGYEEFAVRLCVNCQLSILRGIAERWEAEP